MKVYIPRVKQVRNDVTILEYPVGAFSTFDDAINATLHCCPGLHDGSRYELDMEVFDVDDPDSRAMLDDDQYNELYGTEFYVNFR